MNLKDLLTAPRYGIYLPKAKTTTDVEYTGYGSSFRVSTSLELGGEETFINVKKALGEYLEKSTVYFEENDRALLGMLLNLAAIIRLVSSLQRCVNNMKTAYNNSVAIPWSILYK